MTDQTGIHVALLRGLNVGGNNKLPMADLRAALVGAGFEGVRTYIQSGNVVFSSVRPAESLEAYIEGVLEREFDLRVPVVVRTQSQWTEVVQGNPFSDESRSEPNRVQLCLAKRAPAPDAAEQLQAIATRDERIVAAGAAIWIHFPNGIGDSKLTPAVLDRCVGSSVTARNWRTVTKLQDMLSSM